VKIAASRAVWPRREPWSAARRDHYAEYDPPAVLVLALDTATPAVTAGVVELTADSLTQRSVQVTDDARKHAELLMPGVLAACGDAGIALSDVDAVVTGTGPGPFTGLRVGMVTAAALGDALDVPVHGVCSLDAIAHGFGELVVVTDARRREVYWAAYDADGRRVTGPHVDAPAALLERIPGLGVTAAAGGSAEVTGLPVTGPATPSPAGLVAVAAQALRSGVVPGPLEPLYLRRPDAVEPAGRKRVTAS
jgi:tRNA threonylcarbamoyl adenosine modification protein YeaZ